MLLQKIVAGKTETGLLKAYPQLSKADTTVWECVACVTAEEIVLAES